LSQGQIAEALLSSRKALVREPEKFLAREKSEAEGGCGVIGFASSVQIGGRHLLQALSQMRNRGNNKGGGIAAAGLLPEEFGVSKEVLENDYLQAIAYLDESARSELESSFIDSTFEVDHVYRVPTVEDFKSIPGLELRPPEVYLYFVRPRAGLVEEFRERRRLEGTPADMVEDEFVYQNSYRLNQSFYGADKNRAFVLSHGKNLLVLKMVGYGDDVVRYYKLEDIHAHVWIGHHRYPTKGRVWHPGGAHPFVGLNEALVHNGDFANYSSICEYLAQRNIYPLFQTDTEVSALVFDLHHRIYNYPLEYVIESLAHTTERDFVLLPRDKQRIYEMIQKTHIHGSPDGPWFFLIAQSLRKENAFRLIGITDTSMLRPQVFALQGGSASIGFAASEKQAIDATLESLAAHDPRFWGRADSCWNARGGSHSDGGAFTFTVQPNGNGATLFCADKFGRRISVNGAKKTHFEMTPQSASSQWSNGGNGFNLKKDGFLAGELFQDVTGKLATWTFDDFTGFLENVEASALETKDAGSAVELLTLLMDRHYPTGGLRRSSLLSLVDQSFARLVQFMKKGYFESCIYISHNGTMTSLDGLRSRSIDEQQTVVIDARGFPQEGNDSVAMNIVRLHQEGVRRFMAVHARGHRFIGTGFGPETHDVRIDVYGSSGDYLASGMDGAEIVVHGNAQDQLAQIMKDGTLVVHGDVGQAFMYGAKGGKAFVLGNAAGRPLINAVGKPRVVINGTCLDYLAESFMAGDALNNGGFVILNGITFCKGALKGDEDGDFAELDEPYPGGNLFSLASGGAIYIRDPHEKISIDQLNGGEFAELTEKDWATVKPYLVKNERLFGIPLKRLLTVNGEELHPSWVYRKIRPSQHHALQAEEAWVTNDMDNDITL
jgi:glutamate synthase domain-containing protein 1/glutamate synthase domain-containing protein 3